MNKIVLIIPLMTAKNIRDILNLYIENKLNQNKKIIIEKFLLIDNF